ncbi:hypothetical protein D3C72_1258480 [compost metagenome]
MAVEIIVPKTLPQKGFEIEVHNGEKRSRFVVWSDKTGSYYFGDNGLRERTGKLTEKNYKFLIHEANKIATMSSSPITTCPRMMIKLKSSTGKQSEACLKATTATGKQLRSMTNLLSVLI